VREPFAIAPSNRYPLAEIASDIGAELVSTEFGWVDTEQRLAHTTDGAGLPYDALLLALGALMRPAFAHAVTIDDRRMDELMHGVIEDVEGGYAPRLAFVIPSRPGWPLPIYELALMTAARAYDMSVKVEITIVTPEAAPLAVFGDAASDAVAKLLADAAIETITASHAQVPEPGKLVIEPGDRTLSVDRVIALPELFGPAVRGLPAGEHGFIEVDRFGRVHDAPGVYAAGDAINFPVKHGGVAAQQADAAAQSIAELAGVTITPTPDLPEIHGILLTGRNPLYLTAQLTGSHGFSSKVTNEPTWSPVTKITSKYLAPYLEHRDQTAPAA